MKSRIESVEVWFVFFFFELLVVLFEISSVESESCFFDPKGLPLFGFGDDSSFGKF